MKHEFLERRELLAVLGCEALPVTAGDDVIEIRGDAGEPRIFQDIQPGIERSIGPDRTFFQPDGRNVDHVLSGRGGDDVFRFVPVINAKPEIVAKHSNADGTVNWGMNGVAGENNNFHDHWVEGIGDVTITDFSEGDRIEIEGHTVQYSSWGLGHYGGGPELDSRLRIESDQGNSGAHDDDQLGSITVLDHQLDIPDFNITQADHGIAELAEDVPVRERAVMSRRSLIASNINTGEVSPVPDQIICEEEPDPVEPDPEPTDDSSEVLQAIQRLEEKVDQLRQLVLELTQVLTRFTELISALV